MSKKKTDIICIIDKSGSMHNLTGDTIGGFNTFIDAQEDVPGKAKVTLVLFDQDYHLQYDGKKLKDVPYLTDETYYASGTTALLDAVGRTIEDVLKRHEKKSPDNTVVCIITDGQENASSDYTKERVKELITEQQESNNWEFFFLGANIDAFAEAGGIGIGYTNTLSYEATAGGVKGAYLAVTRAVTKSRTGDDSIDWINDSQASD